MSMLDRTLRRLLPLCWAFLGFVVLGCVGTPPAQSRQGATVTSVGPSRTTGGARRADLQKQRIVPTRRSVPVASGESARLRAMRGKAAAIHVVMAPGSSSRARGNRPRSDPADMDVPTVVHAHVGRALSDSGLQIVSRSRLDKVLEEQELSASPLTDDMIKRIGQLRIADVVAQVTIAAADYENSYYFDAPTPIRVGRFNVRIRVADTATAEVLFDGAHSAVATDLMTGTISFRRTEIESGTQPIQAQVPRLEELIGVIVEELCAEAF